MQGHAKSAMRDRSIRRSEREARSLCQSIVGGDEANAPPFEMSGELFAECPIEAKKLPFISDPVTIGRIDYNKAGRSISWQRIAEALAFETRAVFDTCALGVCKRAFDRTFVAV